MSVLQLNLNSHLSEADHERNELEKEKKKFFRRQFQPEATDKQKVFDWIFGVILPTVCFAFDPGIFRNFPYRGALFGDYTAFAYLLSFTLIMATLALLLFPEKFKAFNAILSGLFLVGGIVALAIGIVLFPFSLLGLAFLIGILGFTPLFTSFVYLRNARRTFLYAKPHLSRHSLIAAFALGATLAASVPAVVNSQIHRLLIEMRTGNESTVKTNAKTLKYVMPLVNTRTLAEDCRYQNGENREKAAWAYVELTGGDIKQNRLF